jgi:hypothetical protein
VFVFKKVPRKMRSESTEPRDYRSGFGEWGKSSSLQIPQRKCSSVPVSHLCISLSLSLSLSVSLSVSKNLIAETLSTDPA